MARKLLTATLVVLFGIGTVFAVTPSGTMTLSYSAAGSGNTCPGATNGIGTATLDGSGNYSVTGNISGTVGTYCIYAHYSGDGNFNPGDATPVIQVVANPGKQNVTVTLGTTPNPSAPNQPITASGSVSPQ